MTNLKSIQSYRLSKAHILALGLLEKEKWIPKSDVVVKLYKSKVVSLPGAPKAIQGLVDKKLVEEKNDEIRLTFHGHNQKMILANLGCF